MSENHFLLWKFNSLLIRIEFYKRFVFLSLFFSLERDKQQIINFDKVVAIENRPQCVIENTKIQSKEIKKFFIQLNQNDSSQAFSQTVIPNVRWHHYCKSIISIRFSCLLFLFHFDCYEYVYTIWALCGVWYSTHSVLPVPHAHTHISKYIQTYANITGSECYRARNLINFIVVRSDKLNSLECKLYVHIQPTNRMNFDLSSQILLLK